MANGEYPSVGIRDKSVSTLSGTTYELQCIHCIYFTYHVGTLKYK